MLSESSASPEGMGEVVQESKGKEGRLSRHTTHAEGLGEAHKWHGKGSSSVLSQTTLLFYRDSPTYPFTFFETTSLLFYFDFNFNLDFNFLLLPAASWNVMVPFLCLLSFTQSNTSSFKLLS